MVLITMLMIKQDKLHSLKKKKRIWVHCPFNASGVDLHWAGSVPGTG